MAAPWEPEPEVLLNISLRVPRERIGSEQIASLILAAIAIGESTTSISLQPYTPD